jgi:PAS domain S-box-containing protein
MPFLTNSGKASTWVLTKSLYCTSYYDIDIAHFNPEELGMVNAMERVHRHPARPLADFDTSLPVLITVFLVAVICYQADRLAYVLGIPPDHIASFWPSTAFLVAVLLLVPRRIWPALITAGLGAMALADFRNGVLIGPVVWITLGNLTETLIATWGIRRLLNGLPHLSSLKILAKYMLFAVILVPFTSGLLGAIGSKPGNYLLQWRLWFFADALAFLTVAPAILTWVHEGREWSRKPLNYLEFAALMTSLFLFGYATFLGIGRGDRPALLYSLVPLLLWAALRFGLKGVSTSLVIVALLSVGGAAHGRGPFSEQGPLNNALLIQLFLFFAGIPFTILAVVVEEQKRVREVLRESEQRFRLVANTAPVMIWMTGPDSRCTFLNQTWLDFTGRSAKTELANTWAEGVHPDDFQHSLDTYTEALDRRQPFRIEHRVRRSDGEYRWVLDVGVPRLDIDGSFAGYIGSAVDVTERKRTEDGLRQKERELTLANDRLRLAMEAAKSVGWDRDVKTGRDTLFGALQSIFGIPSEVYEGRVEDFHRYLFPDDRGRVLEAVNDAMEGKKPYATEFRIIWPDGTVRWLAARGRFYYSPVGEPERMLGMSVDITERKLMEAALRESEERLRLAAQAGKMYAFDWDVATDVIIRSAEANPVFGLNGKAINLTKQQLLTSVHPDDLATFVSSIAGLTPESPNTKIGYRLLRSDGSILWLERSGHAFFDEQGRMVRMIGMVADITERKRAEEGIRQKEMELSEAQRLAQIGSWEWDPITDAVTWSRELYRIAGRNPNLPAANYTEHSQLLTAESWERLQRFVEEAMRSGLPYELDLEYVRPDGSTIWARARGEVQRDTAGRIVRLRGTAQDISQRKLVEVALRESEERLRMAAQAGRMYAFDWDMVTDVVIRSLESTHILGLTDEPTRITFQQILTNIHPEDRAAVMSSVAELTPERPITRISFRMLRPDGSVIWLERSGHAFFDKQGRIQRMVGMVADITDRKLAEEALSKIGGRLIEAHEEERSRIARDLHDDVGQRLALLINDIDGLDQGLPDATVEVRQRIQKLLKRVLEITSDVQAMSHRLHSSKLQYLGIVAAAKSFCQELSEQHKVEIDFTQVDIPTVVPEEISLCLFRVMQESLQNAVKHSGVRHFEVELRGAADGIHLTVRDAGLGFEIEGLGNNRGLGLISMQERVNLLKGTFSIESGPNLGTTIRVRVPLRQGSSSMSAAG